MKTGRGNVSSTQLNLKKALKAMSKVAIVAHPNPRIERIMKSFMFPHDAAPVRDPIGNCCKTTIFRPPFLTSYDFTQPIAVTEDAVFKSRGQMVIGITDDPLHAIYYPLTTVASRVYTMYFNNYDVNYSTPMMSTNFALPPMLSTAAAITPIDVPMVFLEPKTSTGTYAQSQIFAYAIAGRHGVYINATGTNTATVAFKVGTAFAIGSSIRTYILNGDSWMPLQDLIVSAAVQTTNVTIYRPGIFAFSYSYKAGTATAADLMSIEITETSNALLSMSVPGLFGRMNTLSSVGVNAACVLFSQRCPELYSGGEIAVCQFPPSQSIWDTFDYDEIASYPEAELFPANKGLYAYLKPFAKTANKMPNLFTHANGAVRGVSGIMPTSPYPPGGFVLVACRVAINGTTYPGGLFSTVYSFGVEACGTDLWGDPEPADVSAEEYNEAIRMLQSVPNFHENPTHWRDLTKIAARALHSAVQYAPTVLAAIQRVLPHIGSVASWLGAL